MRHVFYAILILLFLFFSISCNRQESELQKVKIPIWSKEAIEKEVGTVFTYEQTIMMKPPFYKGSMPLGFIAGKEPFAMSEMITIYHDFGDFRNTFIYVDPRMKFSGIAEGVITTDRSGRLLAEARILRLISNETKQLQGIEIEEFHYGKDSKLKFKCKSQIDFPMGFKQKEVEGVGKKQKDYYFIWPVRSF